MEILKELPASMQGLRQSSSPNAAIYAALDELDIGGCVRLVVGELGTHDIHALVEKCHTITSTMHVRKSSNKKFSCRRNYAEGAVYIVRVPNRKK